MMELSTADPVRMSLMAVDAMRVELPTRRIHGCSGKNIEKSSRREGAEII